MSPTAPPGPDAQTAPVLLDRAGLQALVDALVARGFDVIGPTLRDGAIVYDRIADLAALPAGWTDYPQWPRLQLPPI